MSDPKVFRLSWDGLGSRELDLDYLREHGHVLPGPVDEARATEIAPGVRVRLMALTHDYSSQGAHIAVWAEETAPPGPCGDPDCGCTGKEDGDGGSR